MQFSCSRPGKCCQPCCQPAFLINPTYPRVSKQRRGPVFIMNFYIVANRSERLETRRSRRVKAVKSLAASTCPHRSLAFHLTLAMVGVSSSVLTVGARLHTAMLVRGGPRGFKSTAVWFTRRGCQPERKARGCLLRAPCAASPFMPSRNLLGVDIGPRQVGAREGLLFRSTMMAFRRVPSSSFWRGRASTSGSAWARDGSTCGFATAIASPCVCPARWSSIHVQCLPPCRMYLDFLIVPAL